MHILKSCTAFFILIFFLSCGSGNQKPSSLFSIQVNPTKSTFQQNETIEISVKNAKQKEITAIKYRIDDDILPVENNKTTLQVATLGTKTLTADISYEGNTVSVTKKIKVLSDKKPQIYTYTIINEYPHDNTSYTQGLEFYKDTLYEGTGKTGQSVLRKLDFKTGEVYKEIKLDATYFGEGISVLNDKIYQLTWKSGLGFIYDAGSLKKLDNFQFGKSKEGWGLTNDGTKLYKSDGTEKIWILNPNTLKEEGYIQTVTNSKIVNKTNELEYVDGKIYANVYQKPSAMIIDSQTGAIEGVINFRGLSKKITKTANWDEVNNVLNGIAYHPVRKTFFVTGKFWDKMFEISIQKK